MTETDLHNELRKLKTLQDNEFKNCHDTFEQYKEFGYDINLSLREGNAHCDTTKNLLKHEVTHSFSSPVVLYRGMESPPHLMRKGRLEDKGFVSTTTNYPMSEHFMRMNNRKETCCVFHIHIPKGQAVKMIPIMVTDRNNFKEFEILLPTNSTLQVITDEALLEAIQDAMGYKVNQDGKYTDWFEEDSANDQKRFGYKTFLSKDGTHIIPVTLVQKEQKEQQEQQEQQGGRVPRKTNEKVLVMGRERTIYKLGRTKYVTYNKALQRLVEVRKMEHK